MNSLRILYCGYHLSGAKVLDELLSTPEEFDIVGIWTSKDPAPIPQNYISVAEEARLLNIPVLIGNPRKAPSIENYLSDIDLIVCVNYRYILPKNIYTCAKYGAINIHGSYLPAYRGRTPNTWAIINGQDYSGASVHIVDEGIDTGPILTQEKIYIDDTDTGYTIFLKQVDLYPKLVRQAIYNLLNPKFVSIKQDESLASEYPARKPEDGEINWSWSALKIYNWIRAQSKPYPGAFTWFKRQKIIVWDALFSREIVIKNTGVPGEIIGTAVSPETSGIWIATVDYPLLLTSVQVAEIGVVSAYQLIKNSLLKIGDILGK